MIKILNNKELYEDILCAIKKHSSSNRMERSEVFQIQQDIYIQIMSLIQNDDSVNLLLLDEDKDEIHAYFEYSQRVCQYELVLYKKLVDDVATLLEIVILAYDIKYLSKNISKEKYKVNFFRNNSNESNPQLLFFRNKIGILPDADLVSKKYNKIQSILVNFLNKTPTNKPSNFLNLKANIDSFVKYNEKFFETFLSNYYPSFADEEYFNNILSLNEEDSRIETIWIYHKEYLKEMGFNDKSDITIFDNYFNELKKHFYTDDVKPLFDFPAKNIKIIFDTGEDFPYKNVFVRINKDESIENILNKELYKYSSVSNVDYVKIENVLLNDYIQNKDEVIQLIKLMHY